MYLLGIETPQQLARDPAFGGLFENMVVVEAVKNRPNSGKDPTCISSGTDHAKKRIFSGDSYVQNIVRNQKRLTR